MTIEQIQSILYYLKDYAEDRDVNLTGVEEAIEGPIIEGSLKINE